LAPDSPATALLAFCLPCGASLLLTAGLIRWAPHLGLVDVPNARKVHTSPTPKGGGLAIFGAFLLGSLVLWTAMSLEAWLALGLGTVIALLGLADDLWALSWQLRLIVQILVAVLAVYLLPIALPWFLKPLAVLWIAGMINAFNMLDNMDWLSPGVACIASAATAVAVVLRDSQGQVLTLLLLMGGLVGFLWFNRAPARIFMGDAGSTFLGFMLGVRTLRGDLIDADSPSSWLVPLLLLTVPIYDLTTVVALRLRQSHSPFHADKQHLSHRLVELGQSKPGAVRVIHLLALANGASAVLVSMASDTAAILVACSTVVWWLALASVEYIPRFGR
jgi:UDP-GlcNAc:undecaprenyl-phosphate GlcNAc-1-phosphate transferase